QHPPPAAGAGISSLPLLRATPAPDTPPLTPHSPSVLTPGSRSRGRELIPEPSAAIFPNRSSTAPRLQAPTPPPPTHHPPPPPLRARAAPDALAEAQGACQEEGVGGERRSAGVDAAPAEQQRERSEQQQRCAGRGATVGAKRAVAGSLHDRHPRRALARHQDR